MAILESHRQLINDAIQSLGIDPVKCHQESSPNLWKLHRGEAQIIIIAQDSVTHSEDTVPTISIMSPIVQIPEDFDRTMELYEYILKTNHKLITESFSISNRWVIISSTYMLDDMRRQEIVHMLDSLSYHAQSFLMNFEEEYSL